MFKRGITTLAALTAPDDGRARIISARLLLDLEGLDAEHVASLRQRIVRGLMLRNTTGKTTWAQRFREIDEPVAEILRSRFPDAVSCLELGASDGSTALDFFCRLRETGEVRYLVTDINADVFVRRGRLWTDVCDDDGNLIQTTIGPFVIPVTRISHMHPLQIVNRLLYLFASVFRKPRVRRDFSRSVGEGGDGAFARMSLLAPPVQRALAEDPRLRFSRLDLFHPPASEFDFVRMLNVLNLKVGNFGFSEEEALRGLACVVPLVREGGLLLLGRTEPVPEGGHVTKATLLEKQGGGRLRCCRRFGGGSELERLLDLSPG